MQTQHGWRRSRALYRWRVRVRYALRRALRRRPALRRALLGSWLGQGVGLPADVARRIANAACLD